MQQSTAAQSEWRARRSFASRTSTLARSQPPHRPRNRLALFRLAHIRAWPISARRTPLASSVASKRSRLLSPLLREEASPRSSGRQAAGNRQSCSLGSRRGSMTQGGWRSTYFRIGTEPDKNPFAALARALEPLTGERGLSDKLEEVQKLSGEARRRFSQSDELHWSVSRRKPGQAHSPHRRSVRGGVHARSG